DEEIAVELEAAAALAASRGAPESAAELFSAAKRLTPPAREEELTSRGLGEAKALLAAGDLAGARKMAGEVATATTGSTRAGAELLAGQGARPELLERWAEQEKRAGPEGTKSVIPLIYFHSIDDFDAARSRHAVESEWYRVRGEEGWVAERLAHLGFVEFRAG